MVIESVTNQLKEKMTEASMNLEFERLLNIEIFRECPVNIPGSKDYKDRRRRQRYTLAPASTGRQAVVSLFVRSGVNR